LEKNLQHYILTSIRSQMNPHFFYNALNTIQAFIVSDDKKNAISYLGRFAKLTRTILEMSEKEKVSLKEEIMAIRLYLEIEKARFGEEFSFEIAIDPHLNEETIRIPSLLIQPYIENALKHGLLHKKGNKFLLIEFRKQENALMVGIEDNGIGRKKSAEINAQKPGNHRSFATQAIQRRIEILNEGKAKKINLDYIDKEDAFGTSTGTLVTLTLPLK
jgi:LytS/YehU family sensor histidine kinase